MTKKHPAAACHVHEFLFINTFFLSKNEIAILRHLLCNHRIICAAFRCESGFIVEAFASSKKEYDEFLDLLRQFEGIAVKQYSVKKIYCRERFTCKFTRQSLL